MTLDTIFYSDLIANKIPTLYNGECLVVEKQSTTDFSQSDFVEFDSYVEDANAIKSAMERSNLWFNVINGYK